MHELFMRLAAETAAEEEAGEEVTELLTRFPRYMCMSVSVSVSLFVSLCLSLPSFSVSVFLFGWLTVSLFAPFLSLLRSMTYKSSEKEEIKRDCQQSKRKKQSKQSSRPPINQQIRIHVFRYGIVFYL